MKAWADEVKIVGSASPAPAAAVVFSTLAVAAAIELWQYQGPMSPWLLMWIALTLLVAQWRSVPRPSAFLRLALIAFGLAFLYGGLKTATGWLLQGHMPNHTVSAFSAEDLWACALFLGLFGVAICLRYYANLPWVRRLSMTLFAGLYLDEWFTKITLILWPVNLPAYSKAKHHGIGTWMILINYDNAV